MSARNRVFGLVANAGLLVGSLLFVELVLQLGSLVFVKVDLMTRPPWGWSDASVPMLIDDARLGHKGNPAWWDHDDRGFRNRSTLSRAGVVALGDSHTYGTSVIAEEAWPTLLSGELGVDVYNMGIGGYGAAHGNENLATALQLEPDLVIFGLYFGNDFRDDFRFAETNGLLGEFVSVDAIAEIEERESKQTIEEEIGFMFRAPGAERQGDGDQSPSRADKDAERPGALRKWISDHSKIYGLLRNLKNQIGSESDVSALLARDFDEARKKLTERERRFVSVYDGPVWKTILTSPYRLRTLDAADPRVTAGIEVSKSKLAQMRDRAREGGVRFLVLLLPTKEYVFWPKVEEPDDHRSLADLVRNEERARAELIAFMTDRRIDFVDPAGELRQSEHQPYFPDGDGHPNALGHGIIAEKVLGFVRENNVLAQD